ncbi:MAG TPA: biotin--[acetyl-CoA-carboxylase] ligase [Acidimicrobiales bacterium]|nr:biotin--[acetyl-CoA-carboxylase] ligase [Acidimicrobiales bacterium]
MNLDERVRSALAAETRFTDIRLLAETASTNDLVADLAAAGAPEGLVVTADFQTAGRGRLDRTWEAHPGDGLLVSVLLRPAGLPIERRALVASAVALAGRTACREVADVTPEIKWPNDLLSPEGAKLAGILAVEASGAVVVGMGLNVHGGPPGAAYLDALAGRRVDRASLLESWLRALDRLAADWDRVAARYRQECATVGRRVSVELSGGQVVVGTAEAVDELGLLVLRLDDGSVRSLSVGDVTHLR